MGENKKCDFYIRSDKYKIDYELRQGNMSWRWDNEASSSWKWELNGCALRKQIRTRAACIQGTWTKNNILKVQLVCVDREEFVPVAVLSCPLTEGASRYKKVLLRWFATLPFKIILLDSFSESYFQKGKCQSIRKRFLWSCYSSAEKIFWRLQTINYSLRLSQITSSEVMKN